MNVVLVLPPYDLSQSYGGKGMLKRGGLPPLGVGYLAAIAKAAGHESFLLDFTVQSCDAESAAEAILEKKPSVIGISTLSKMAASAYELCKTLKRIAPNIPIVMGGPHVTSFYENIFDECPDIDILVPGEGEATFQEVLGCLSQNTPISAVQGIVYRDPNGHPAATAPRTPVDDLDLIAPPLRSIYDPALYIPLPNQCRRKPATTVITARGCSYGKCRFCYQGGKYASPYRRRSPENVIAEIRQLVNEYGIREVIFWDDNFAVDIRWIERFCNLLDQEPYKLTWTAQGRVNTVTQAMLRRMAASGCYNIYYGFESGNQAMLNKIKKGITLEQSRRAVKWAKEAGMEIRGSFIFGLPGETPAIAEETIRFACELNIDWMIFYPYHIQPGTSLAEIAEQEGRTFPQSLDMHMPSYVPNAYETPEQLANIIQSAYRRYYFRPRYCARALWQLRHPAALKNYIQAFLYWLSLQTKKRR